MSIELDKQQRLEEYRVLYAKIPGEETTDKLDWLVDNLHCSRQTAWIWNMKASPRPIPSAKLKIMRQLLKVPQ